MRHARGAARLRDARGRHHRGRGPAGAGARRESKRLGLARRQPRRPRRVGRRLRPGGRLHRRRRGARSATTSSGSTRAGCGRSAPIDCLSDAELDAFLGSDPTPDDAAEEQAFAATAAGLRAEVRRAPPARCSGTCRPSTRPRTWTCCVPRSARRSSTTSASPTAPTSAPTYADLFPQHVGRFVLDGVVAPDLTSAGGQPRAGQGLRDRDPGVGAASASSKGDCPLGGSVDDVMQGLRDFLGRGRREPAAADRRQRRPAAHRGLGARSASPPRCTTRACGTRSSRRCATRSTATAPSSWGSPTSTPTASPGGGYARQHHGGHLRGQLPRQARVRRPRRARGRRRGVDGGGADVGAVPRVVARCPAARGRSRPSVVEPPTKVTAEGADPIVVVGTTRDPATPYEWSVRLHDQLAKSLPHHLRRRRAHGIHAVQRVRRRADRRRSTSRAPCPKDGLTC